MQEQLPETATAIGMVTRIDFRLPERWQVGKRLGAGGQGEVWAAFDRELKEWVAVKVLTRPDDVTAVERLRQEVSVGRKLQHQHLVRVYELVDAGPSMAVVMEYLEGGSLSARISEDGLPVREVEQIADALLDALACLHREGIVHRDVKPANVLFNRDGVPKLGDFGTLSSEKRNRILTETRMTVGTPAYMSPEQLRGEKAAPPSDLFSLGITLYHLLTGKRPFEADSDFELARKQLSEKAADLRALRPDCPGWLAGFVHRLLEKDPTQRWKDGNEAHLAFRRRHWRPTGKTILRKAGMACLLSALAALGFGLADRIAGVLPVTEGNELVIRNSLGRKLWQKHIEGLQAPTVAADLLPEPGKEVIAAAANGKPGAKMLTMFVLNRRGRILRRFELSTRTTETILFPEMSSDFQLTALETDNLGSDLGPSVLWIAGDRSWYPAEVGLFSSSRSHGPTFLLTNSGHCKAVRAADINGNGRKEILITGINNELGFQAFVAIVDPLIGNARSPDLFSPEVEHSGGAGLLSYVVIGESDEARITFGSDPAHSEVFVDKRRIKIGSSGDIGGIEPEASMAFWEDVVRVANRLRIGEGAWRVEIDNLGKRQQRLWRIDAFRGGAAFMLARSLAEGDQPAEGADLLEIVRKSGVHFRRLDRRAGELQLIAGHRKEGRDALKTAILSVGRGFGPVDECIFFGLDAALHQDTEVWKEISKLLKYYQFDNYRRQLETVYDFFGGRFSSCGRKLLMGPGVHHRAFVLRNWAAVEEGRANDQTLADLEALQLRAECTSLATLALARWEVLHGQSGPASDAAGEAVWKIKDRCLLSWPDRVYLPLAQWACGTVFEARGQINEARSLYREAAGNASDSFFGRDAATRLSSGIPSGIQSSGTTR